jgi:PTS system sucrose-specific IIC component
MAGGAVGAMLGSWMGLGAKAYGVTGIPGYLTINKPVQYTIMLLVSGGIAFVSTWIIWQEDQEALKKEQARAAAEKAAEKALETFEAPKNYVMTCKEGKVLAPAKGEVVSRENIPDPTFASGLLGDGVGINPEVGIVIAPFDGTISSIAASKHAIGLTSAEGGMELLIHVGVDTVKMEGEGFEPQVKEGDTVKEGDIILRFSKEAIENAGYKDCVVVLMANSDAMTDFKAGDNL